MKPSEEFFQQQRGFDLKTATPEALAARVIEVERENMALNNRLWVMKQRYGQFEAVYSENEQLKANIENQANAYNVVLEAAKKGKL